MSSFHSKYRLDARLGGGGMAEVFIGSTVGAEGFSRRVAIKRVLPGYSDNPQFSQMFVAEARISSRLVHPNIVSVMDFDRDAENRLFLVMELVDGKDLDALISTGQLPYSAVIHLIAEMLRGLGYAHDLPISEDNLRGVVHRDVSPHNVLLSWEGATRVSDFGIAKAREASEATASVFIKGKPAYMSPEQANGQALDGRSDLFAVGIILWEMLVARRLFAGADTRSTLAQVLFGQIPRPRGQRSDVPKDLERVCMKLLERDPKDRYLNAESAIADLMKCAGAPRAGRDELVALLAARFPDDAPRRGSQGARPSAQTPAEMQAASVPRPPSLADPASPQPISAMTVRGRPLQPDDNPSFPETPAANNAPTRTSVGDARPAMPMFENSALARRKRLIGGAAIALVAGTVAVTLLLSSKEPAAVSATDLAVKNPVIAVAPTNGSAANLPAAPAVIPMPAAITPDAAPNVAVDAAPVVKTVTPVPIPPGPESAPDKPVPRASDASKKYGFLEVVTDPPCEVLVNGRKVGTSYLKTKVPAGKVKLTLINADRNIRESFGVTITEGKTTPVNKNF